MNTTEKLTEQEKIVIETKIDIYNKVKEKVQDIEDGEIGADYYLVEIDRKLSRLKSDLSEEDEVEVKIDVVLPKFSPKDSMPYAITDKSIMFTVMEVNHNDRTYKIKSKNQVKPITLVVDWDELEGFNESEH